MPRKQPHVIVPLPKNLQFPLIAVLIALIALLSERPASGQELSSLPLQKQYTQERVSSADPTGANDDGNWKHPIKAGEERTIANITGAGIITHLWFTIASDEHYHLKKIVLRT